MLTPFEAYVGDGLAVDLTLGTGSRQLGLFSSRGELRETHQQIDDVQIAMSRREYDVLGRLVTVEVPHAYGEAPAGTTTYGYDLLARSLGMTNPDGTFTTSEYPDLFTVVGTDETGRRSRSRFDGLGRLTEATEFDGERPVSTKYEYYPFGETKSVQYPSGSKVEYQIDGLGRTIRTVDPDVGVTKTLYDGFSQPRLVRHGGAPSDHDNLQYAETYEFDRLGRPVFKSVQCDGAPDCRDEEYSYLYDAAPNAAGSLVRAESHHDGIAETFAYDSLGRISSAATFLDGESYVVSTEYDSQNRPRSVTYPTKTGLAFEASYSYSDFGFFESVSDQDDVVYWQVARRTVDGLVEEARRRNGGEGLTETFRYGDRMRRLERHRVYKSPSFDSLVELGYEYHDDGQLSRRTEKVGLEATPQTGAVLDERYAYDYARRLESWTREGVDRFSTTTGYDYDDDANLLQVSHATAMGVPQPSEAYDYQPSRPHAPVKAGDMDMSYDRLGRAREKRRAGELQWRLDYNSFDLPHKTTSRGLNGQETVTEYRYNAFGERVVKATGADKTIYVGGIYERRVGPGGSDEIYKVYSDGGLVGQVTRSGEQETHSFAASDRRGSVVSLFGLDGERQQARHYSPWGQKLDANGLVDATASEPNAVTMDFTGHELDGETGLVNMGGRLYDGGTRRTLTGDPYVADATASGWNPFSYAANDPLNMVDPSGLKVIAVDFSNWEGPDGESIRCIGFWSDDTPTDERWASAQGAGSAGGGGQGGVFVGVGGAGPPGAGAGGGGAVGSAVAVTSGPAATGATGVSHGGFTAGSSDGRSTSSGGWSSLLRGFSSGFTGAAVPFAAAGEAGSGVEFPEALGLGMSEDTSAYQTGRGLGQMVGGTAALVQAYQSGSFGSALVGTGVMEASTGAGFLVGAASVTAGAGLVGLALERALVGVQALGGGITLVYNVASGGGGSSVRVTSAIGNHSGLSREASKLSGAHQRSADDLVKQLAGGNMNPGTGTKFLFRGIFEARARNGARVYFRQTSSGGVEILAKSTKANQGKVIKMLQEAY